MCRNVLHLKCAMEMIDTKCPSCRSGMFDCAPSVDPAPNYATEGADDDDDAVAPNLDEVYDVCTAARNCLMYFCIFLIADHYDWFAILEGALFDAGADLLRSNIVTLLNFVLFVLPMIYLHWKDSGLSAGASSLWLIIRLFQLALAYVILSLFIAKISSRGYQQSASGFQELANNWKDLALNATDQIHHIQGIATDYNGLLKECTDQLRHAHETTTNFEALAMQSDDRLNHGL